MSQTPSHTPGLIVPALPYESWPMPKAPTRPAIIPGLAWTGIVLGIIWANSAVFGVIGNGIMLANGGTYLFMANNAPKVDPVFAKFGFVQAFWSLPFITVLIFGCIGALKGRASARTTMMVWSVAAILYALATTVAQIVWVAPAGQAMMQSVNTQIASFMGNMMIIMAIVSGIVYCVLPVLFLIFWSRPHVKAAFAMATPPPLPLEPPAASPPGQQSLHC